MMPMARRRCVARALIFLVLFTAIHAFTPRPPALAPKTHCARDVSLLASSHDGDDENFFSSIVTDLKTRVRIAQESSAAGSAFTQTVANVLAGEYDADIVRAELVELTKSAPCVMFIWEASPFSKKAIQAMQVAGADVKIVRLDDPWSKGHPLRAELGKLTGKTSVPSIWIGGEYVGGFDGGVSDEKPGIVDLAFRGTLRPMLEAAGALKPME